MKPPTVGRRSTARATAFDLVLLDVMLPGLDGVSVCRAIRSAGANVDTPILMLTAREGESDKVLGLGAELGRNRGGSCVGIARGECAIRARVAHHQALSCQHDDHEHDEADTDAPVEAAVPANRRDGGRHAWIMHVKCCRSMEAADAVVSWS